MELRNEFTIDKIFMIQLFYYYSVGILTPSAFLDPVTLQKRDDKELGKTSKKKKKKKIQMKKKTKITESGPFLKRLKHKKQK